ncbi:hypothetical protein BFP72_04185 [Reichenbachiella sp. 5M10]|nr:hypothetical protein BFP72_04185 [Reichenbachiella sp. 5M10]
MKDGEYDSAIHYAQKILSFSTSPNNRAYAQSIIGYSWFMKKNYDSAYHYYTESLKSERNVQTPLKASSLNMLGIIFEIKEAHPTAVHYFQKSISVYEPLNDPHLATVYYNLAYNQSQTNNIDCLDSYYKALSYASDFNNERIRAFCLNDLGNLMLETKNYESAKEYYSSVLQVEYTHTSPFILACAIQGLGETAFHTHDLATAQKHAVESLNIKIENGLDESLFTSYLLLGRIARETQNLAEAETNFKRAIVYYPMKERNKKFVDVFKELSQVEEALGNVKLSEYYNRLHFEELENILADKKKTYGLSKIEV